MTPQQHLSPWAIALAEIAAGAIAASEGHPHVPAWLAGAIAALVVGMALRLMDPTLKLRGERLARRLSEPPTAPLTRSVLVVDDVAAARELMAMVLRDALAVPVYVASTAAEARAMWAAHRCAVVVCDLMLPDGLGDEVLSALPRRVRAVLTSGVADESALLASAIACRATPLAKPLDPSALLAVVRTMLG